MRDPLGAEHQEAHSNEDGMFFQAIEYSSCYTMNSKLLHVTFQS